MKHFKKMIAIVIAALSYGISHAQVVNPVDKNNIANGGYDMVAYFTDNAPVKGNVQFTTEYKKIKYQFASAEHLNLFNAAPEKYLPVCDGYCAWGVAEKGKRVPVNPQTYKIINGKLHLFFNGDFNGSPFNTLEEWNKNEKQLLVALPVKWEKLKKQK
ncbi:MAG: YHS domain protein [Bacteroidetes bacterium]|nr:YHS domain protein [Bacteroidota bacterium]